MGQGAPRRASAASLRCLLGAVLPLVLFPACGRRGELLGTIEAASLPSAPRFGAPQLVTALSTPSSIDEDPTFTADLLEVCFMSNRDGTKDIWTSHRAAATDAWAPPVRVAELSSAADDWGPALTPDGLVVWFVTDRDTGRAQLWRATRASRTGAWGAPTAVAELASSAIDLAPSVDAADRTLYFASDRPGAAGYDIYVSTRPSTNATWGAPVAAPGINSAEDDVDPFIADGGLQLFFTRVGSGNEGNIYWAARRSTTDAWAPAVPLNDVNSPSYDSDPSLSPDLSYLMFSSMRTGNGDIYEAHALP